MKLFVCENTVCRYFLPLLILYISKKFLEAVRHGQKEKLIFRNIKSFLLQPLIQQIKYPLSLHKVNKSITSKSHAIDNNKSILLVRASYLRNSLSQMTKIYYRRRPIPLKILHRAQRDEIIR